jgi:hypothetical protein
MLQTLIWRTFRAAPAAAPGESRRGRGTLLLPLLSALVGVLALLCAGMWTAGQYAEHRAELRLAETNRFLDQFRSGPVADAWVRLRTAWRSERGRQDALLARISSLAGWARARTVHEHQMFVLETIEEYGLQDEIEVVHQFVSRLATCVRMDTVMPMSPPHNSGRHCGPSATSTATTSSSNIPGSISTPRCRASRRA